MDSRERVLAAARRERPDRTPRDFWAEKPALGRILAHTGHADEEALLETLGIDILDPIQPAGPEMAPERLRADFGGSIAFHGGIDVQGVLPRGTPEGVRREARRYCEAFPNGGYILAPSHLFQPDIAAENVLAVYDAAP